MKKILLVSAEAVPFAKTGGLADVVGTLPQAFDREEFDVRVIMPKYKAIDEKYKNKMEYIKHIYIDLGWRSKYCGVFKLEHEGCLFYFIDNEFYFGGDKLYSYIHEDIEKFAFFSKAVLSILPHIDFRPDILHLNDWHTGLVPVMLDAQFRDKPFYQGIKTIMTIHNLKFQGIWGLEETKDATGLDGHYFTADKLEYKGDANLLKGGLVYADHITTVSDTYAKEIQTPAYGEGLEGLLLARRDSLTGIVNGISYSDYNPANDDSIFAKYNRRDFPSRKRLNKTQLQGLLGLEKNPDTFLIGIVSRLTKQKGLDLIAYNMDRLLSQDVQLVVLGTGEPDFENMFRYYAGLYPKKVSANILFSNDLAHKIYAAADAYLMPSLFEPCGLSQLISMRYGTVPIVRETGGLVDTVIPYNKYTSQGTGFSFRNYNGDELWSAISYAMEIHQDRRVWNSIIRQGMAKDFSWQEAAKKYANLYSKLIV